MSSAAAVPEQYALPARAAGVWEGAWARLREDRVGVICLAVVTVFVALILLAALGVVAGDWQRERGVMYAPPAFLGADAAAVRGTVGGARGERADLADIDPLAPRYAEWKERAAKFEHDDVPRATTLPFGGDRLGRDVLAKAVKGAQVSVMVGVSAALLATLIGTLLGAIGGYAGGKVSDFLEWVYNVFTSIPDILLIFSFAAVLGRGIESVVIILGLAGWTGMYRQVRAEYMKHRSREYVRAAEALGVSHLARIFVHILPNVSHVVLVRLSLLVVAFIKAEVILSFLGLGVPVDQVSWGTMLAEANVELVLGKWWQLAATAAFMATFVTAFSLLTDALRDALDPKLR